MAAIRIEGLAKARRRAHIGEWGDVFNIGVDRMRRLVCEYYDIFVEGDTTSDHPARSSVR